jgi:cytochrome c553
MKKLLILLATILALLLAFYGRELLDLYRLISYIERSTETYEAEGGPWPQLADACVVCHGYQGSSEHPAYPSLAGQPAAYTATQLRRFASGERANPNMGPLAMTLSEAEILRLAEHFASQHPRENPSFVADAALSEQGRQRVTAGGCAACHGETLMGRDQNPRLAGQGYDYLLAQLEAFASGTRKDPSGVMNSLAAATSAEDRKAIAQHLATLAPAAAN